MNWQCLAEIRELSEYFEADPSGFRQRIQAQMDDIATIEAEQLDKLALLRVLEVTNGCTQHAFRRGDPDGLSAEQTRSCMQTVIGFIKDKRIDFPSGEIIHFSPKIEALIEAGRSLYQEAFKRNNVDARRDYFAMSTAQFLIYGRARLEAAMERVAEAFGPMFGPVYIAMGQRWIGSYLEALGGDDHGTAPPSPHSHPSPL